MNSTNTYTTRPVVDDDQTKKFAFLSKGKNTISKLIAYTPLGDLNGRTVYNLGFGDYNNETNRTDDGQISNNGDRDMVFNTVLHTVPLFFTNNPHDVITVQGSDSNDDENTFEQSCRVGCKKKCTGQCKNLDRRIRIYLRYINTYFDELVQDYLIFGSYRANKTDFSQYIPREDYIAVLVYKKNSLTL